MESVADDEPAGMDQEFRRRTKTQSSLPGQDAVLLLLSGLRRSGQVKLRALVGYRRWRGSEGRGVVSAPDGDAFNHLPPVDRHDLSGSGDCCTGLTYIALQCVPMPELISPTPRG